MERAALSPTPPAATARDPRPYVAAVAAVSGLALLASLLLAAKGGRVGAGEVLLALGLALGVWVVQQASIPFEWRGQRLTVSIEEGVIFLALVTLPAETVPAIVLAGCALTQMVARRPLLKATFNVATYVLGAALAAALFTLLAGHLGVPPMLAAFPAIGLYAASSNVAVAGLFARIEGGADRRVLLDRFALPAALQLAFGGSVGVVMTALWNHHPGATVAVLPFVLLARGYVRLTARADRELVVHRRLASMTHEMVGRPDATPAVQHALESCGNLLMAGEATLTLHDAAGATTRSWTRRFEGGPAPGFSSLATPLSGPDGAPVGTLAIRPRHPQEYGPLEREMLKIVAGQASAAASNAAALGSVLELKNLHEGIVRNVPAGVMRLDGAGHVLQANPALLAMLGPDATDPAGASVFDWTPFATHPALCREIQNMLDGHPFHDVELSVDDRLLSIGGVPLPRTPGAAPTPSTASTPHAPASPKTPPAASTGGVLLVSDVTARRDAEEALRRQTLTRPIVRRIVLDLVGRVGATPRAIADVGRSLAQEVQGAKTPDEYAHTFRAMGLGDLRFEKADNGTYTFHADDLLERRKRSAQPTCHLALGYVEGVVATLHARHALGSEIRCQSQGHPRCVFVAQPRAIPIAPSTPTAKVAPKRDPALR